MGQAGEGGRGGRRRAERGGAFPSRAQTYAPADAAQSAALKLALSLQAPAELPVVKLIGPLTPAVPALAEPTVNAPEDDCEPKPVARDTAPPMPGTSSPITDVLCPPETTMRPPRPDVPDPTTIETSPPAPSVPPPLRRTTAPLLPALDVPVENATRPLVPPVVSPDVGPPSAVLIENAPEEVAVP